jgi:N6-L-threonylcarbamoyladenine synthase
VRGQILDAAARADLAAEFESAVVDVLVAKSRAALRMTQRDRLVVAGGVGANRRLRAALDAAAAREGFAVFYPDPALCTDNGAMIAFAGAQRLRAGLAATAPAFTVRPRWDLESVGQVTG